MNLKLHVVICSTRPGRQGPPVAEWFHGFAAEHGRFDASLVDLADFNLPVFDEPHHPRLQKYQQEHTKRWAASVADADAFVFVTPEYNFGPPPSLLNALNYLVREWAYKPAGFVSYGGISGGLRSVQVSKLTLTALKMMPMTEGVVVPGFAQQIGSDGMFVPSAIQIQGAKDLLAELYRWAGALKPLREPPQS